MSRYAPMTTNVISPVRGALLIFSIALFSGGCRTGRTAKNQADREHTRRTAEADEELAERLVTRDHVVDKFVSDRSALIQHLCGGEQSDFCEGALADVLIARLREAYPLADWVDVAEQCQAHPVECYGESVTEGDLETRLRRSHNAGAQAARDAAVNQSDEQRQGEHSVAEAEAQKTNAQWGEAIRKAGESFRQRPR